MRLQAFLEKKGEKAHRDAIAMGLQYKGFGYWADPNTGEAKYKTVNDQLVPVTPDEESELYKGDEKEGPGMMSGTPQQGGMAQPGADAAQGPSVGSGDNIQGGLGVDANAPQKKGWDAGPDGDTCVGGQPREDVPPDTFVGKTNNKNWTAGPDGSHALELGEMRRMIEQDDSSFNREFQRKLAADRKINKMRDGKDVSPVGQITRNKIKGMLNRNEMEPDSMDNVGAALGAAGPKSKDSLGQRVQRRLELAQKFGDAAGGPTVDKELAAKRQGQRKKDANTVEYLNDTLKTGGFFADPEYDMNDVGEAIGEGAFGSVYLGNDGQSVVKEGEIGLEELAVLRKLRDNPMFPTLLNASITSPFSHTSSVKNNPDDRPSQRRGPGEVAYFDPDEQEEFDDRFPTARGRYAMSLAKGRQFGDVIDELYNDSDEAGIHKLLESAFRARRDMHMEGIAHNDMHGGNMMVDENGALNIIDLGLAEDNPVAALMEGLGAISGADQQFFMGAAPGGIGNVLNQFTPYEMDDRFQENIGNIEQMIMDSFDDDPDDENYDMRTDVLDRIMKGGIRQPKATWPNMAQMFPIFGDNEKVIEMIKMLYKGTEDAPVQDRMSQAFDRLKDTTDGVLNLKTDRRLRKGEPLVPRKNLDIDD